MRLLGIDAPLVPALLLYAVGWAGAFVAGHAVFPRAATRVRRVGRRARARGASSPAPPSPRRSSAVSAPPTRFDPPTVHLHGTVQGPLVIRHAETYVGGVVHGGVVIEADHVTLRHVTVVGGQYGIDIEHANHVMLDQVRLLRCDAERDPGATTPA